MINSSQDPMDFFYDDDIRDHFDSGNDREYRTGEIIYGIRKVLRMNSYSLPFTAVMYIAYLIYLMRYADSRDITYIREEFDSKHENLSEIIDDISSEKLAEVADTLAYRFLPEDFLKVATMDYPCDRERTPESIAAIAASILDVKEYGNVLDLGCGTGTFAGTLQKKVRHFTCTGIENDNDKCLYAKLRNATDNHFRMRIINEDAFEYLPKSGKKYDRIFANFPFRTREEYLTGCGREYAGEIKGKLSIPGSLASADWLYNSLVMDYLNEDGKAVSVITNGSANNACDTAFRKYFIENGYIECVINLPERMYEFPPIGTSIVVLSRGNKGVRIIDAKGLCEEGRRHNFLSDSAVDEILGYASGRDSKISKYIPNEELEKNNYSLTLNRYGDEANGSCQTVRLSDVIKRITRGKQLSAKELDALVTSKETGCCYLTAKDINGGIIELKLPQLTGIDKKFDKYCAKHEDLVISKAEPYKVAEISTGANRILASGNLYIITIDETKVLPMYVKAYLESRNGREALERISTGSTVKSIGVEGIKSLEIPVIPMDEQTEFVRAYKGIENSIRVELGLINMKKNGLMTLFDSTFNSTSAKQQ